MRDTGRAGIAGAPRHERNGRAVIARYTRDELGRLWTDEARMESWRRVEVAACEELREDEAYELVRRAWPYRELPRSEFDALVEMHAEGVARRAGRAQGARLHRGRLSVLAHTIGQIRRK